MAAQILSGPDKPALLWAVQYPEKSHVDFEVEGAAPLRARVCKIVEQTDGFTYKIAGTIISRPYQDCLFQATYHVGSGNGSVEIVRPISPTVPIASNGA